MTYGEAKAKGYKDAGTSLERGYVSRKIDTDAQPVLTAGGCRKGEQYVLIPCFYSSQYRIRQYITL